MQRGGTSQPWSSATPCHATGRWKGASFVGTSPRENKRDGAVGREDGRAMNGPTNFLRELDEMLTSAKARAARRLLLAGSSLDRALFRGHHALTNAEADALAIWEPRAFASRVVERAPSSD